VTKEQENFLKQVAGPALESERTYSIPACVTIAQAILESAGQTEIRNSKNEIRKAWTWGGSSLFRLANNPFGIKNRELPDDYGFFEVETAEYSGGEPHRELARFEKFRSLHDAFACHAALISGSVRYKPAMAQVSNWRKFAEALGPKKGSGDAEHCGYATDPRYAAKLKNLIRVYQLDDHARLKALAGVPEAIHMAVEGVDV